MDVEYRSYTNNTIDGNVGISSVEKWSMETSTGASKNDMNLRLEDRRYNGRREKKRKRRLRPLGDFNWTLEKHKLPAGAAGGQLPAGIAAEIYIYIKRYFYSRIPSLAGRR